MLFKRADFRWPKPDMPGDRVPNLAGAPAPTRARRAGGWRTPGNQQRSPQDAALGLLRAPWAGLRQIVIRA